MQTLEARLGALVKEYALAAVPALVPTLSLRRDLAIDSLSLVSLALRVGDELGVDLVERGVDLARLDTIGDLFALGRSLLEQGEDHD
jgi:acyl carrier protein